ncbi:MAG: carbohydrate ABC transporter permease [Lachnospiraceae bacterium]|nr:carbohydrate ABC transporter permease [Lachnospiraceae bacterium]
MNAATKTKKVKKPASLGSKVFDVVNYSILAIVGFIMLYPMWYVLVVSISSSKFISLGEVAFIPKGITFEAYERVFDSKNIWTGYKNTIVYTVVGTIINVGLSAMCAYPLSRKEFYGRRILTILITITMFVSGGLIPLYLVVNHLHLMNTMWAVILPSAISTYNMIIMRTSFEAIPDALVESAYLDGANDLVIFRYIIIPLSKAITATMVLFYSVSHWNSYFPAMLYLNSKAKYPVQVIMRDIIIGSDMSEAGDTSALSMVSMTNYRYAVIIISLIPILLVYPFIQKYFTKGVMVGAVKG